MHTGPLLRIVVLATVVLGCGSASSSVAPAATPAPMATTPSTTATAAAVGSPSPDRECAAGPDEVWLEIDAKSNLFGAGLDVPPDPAGGGGGRLPPVVELPEGGTRVVTIQCTAGLTDCCGATPLIGPEGYPQLTDIESAGGISGIKADLLLFLAGVFLSDEPPAAPAPERLDFTDATEFERLEPQLGQSFYIGDGEGRTFAAPTGATRLYLGFIDGFFAEGPPGYYNNNRGALEATVKVTVD